MVARVQIQIEARDGASGVLRGITSQFGSLGRVIDDLTAKDFNAGTLATSLTTFAIEGAKKIYEFTKAGAQLELVETRFDRLATSIGTTKDALLEDLREATRGLYSDAELMQSATDLMALGLANTHDEAVRLASVSAGLNMNMNQLVLTLTNMTTMRFDALGVRVDGFKDKVKALEEAGMSADEAFREAFLQQAEEQLLKVGHAAETAAGQIMQLEAAWKNQSDTMKRNVMEAMLPLITHLNETWEEQRRVKEALEATNTALFRQYNATGLLNPEMEKLVDAYYRAEGMAEAFAIRDREVAGTIEETIEVVKEAVVNYKELIPSIMNVQDATDKYRDTQTELLKKKQQLNAELDQAVATYGAESQAANDVRGQLAELDGALAENAAAHEEWAKKTIFAFAQARAAADGEITAMEGELLITLGESLGLFDEQSAQAARAVNSAFESIDTENAQEMMDAMLDSLQALTGQVWNVQVNVDGLQTISAAPGSEGQNPGGGGRQSGGTVYAGAPYMVGEAGREPFFPAVNGRILGHAEAMHAMSLGGGGGGVTMYNYGPITISPDAKSGSDLMSIR